MQTKPSRCDGTLLVVWTVGRWPKLRVSCLSGPGLANDWEAGWCPLGQEIWSIQKGPCRIWLESEYDYNTLLGQFFAMRITETPSISILWMKWERSFGGEKRRSGSTDPTVSLDLKTYLYSLQLNLDARRSTSGFPHLQQRAWNTSGWLKQSTWQFSMRDVHASQGSRANLPSHREKGLPPTQCWMGHPLCQEESGLAGHLPGMIQRLIRLVQKSQN